jgi:serine/threonine protein kinase
MLQQQKLQWAVDAARSVAALHEMDVIHADIQTQQFLITVSGTVALNDLNRCRFVPHYYSNTTSSNNNNHNNSRTESCPVRIPTAPGPWRAPEEYFHQNLTTSLDVYSLGNVLYELWTGQVPFTDIGAKIWKKMIEDGTRPSSSLLKAMTTPITELDRQFAQLLDHCWYVDPTQRITAEQLVTALEELVRTYHLNP